jgi:hypothetical protein
LAAWLRRHPAAAILLCWPFVLGVLAFAVTRLIALNGQMANHGFVIAAIVGALAAATLVWLHLAGRKRLPLPVYLALTCVNIAVVALGFPDRHTDRYTGPKSLQVVGDLVLATSAAGLVIVLITATKRIPRRPLAEGRYALSGFTSADSYRRREPDWQADGLPDLHSARSQAQRWLAAQPAEAQVEVIESSNGTGAVRQILTSSSEESVFPSGS